MKLKLKAMPFGTEVFNYRLTGEFFNRDGETEVRGACVDAAVTVVRKNEDTFSLALRCQGWLTVGCDRCLDDLRLAVEADYALTVRFEGTVYDDATDGVLLLPEGWHELDVAPLLRDTVLLDIPTAHSHDDVNDCNPEMLARLKGVVVQNQPEAAAQHRPDNIDPRWDALRQLNDNK